MANNHTSLATKYRPRTFEEMSGQETIKHILQYQLDTKTYKQCYLFAGKWGCGKTSSARIFARTVNNGNHDIIEIDAATYNSVDQIRVISEEAKKMPLVGKYKIFIIDEAHSLSLAANNALLKILEEPPKTAMFILCTTDPQKMLNTVLSRVQRYDFTSIPTDEVISRLRYIADAESIDIDDASIRYIAKISGGSMRDSISNLDKCASVSEHITLNEVTNALAVSSYHDYLDLLISLVRKDSKSACKIIVDTYEAGKDMKKFISSFMWSVCDVCNSYVFNSFDYVNIPELPEYVNKIKTVTLEECLPILEWAKTLNAQIRNETDPKNAILVEVMLLTQAK